ncbi:hypothetical protein GCM10022202_26710 [Microbacterium marinilacus]|uniref:Uncharacterized protein n=1 Tax=Microbacterium marinilacus TaxID=415209 RepID=A0ABP7BL75_9MICO
MLAHVQVRVLADEVVLGAALVVRRAGVAVARSVLRAAHRCTSRVDDSNLADVRPRREGLDFVPGDSEAGIRTARETPDAGHAGRAGEAVDLAVERVSGPLTDDQTGESEVLALGLRGVLLEPVGESLVLEGVDVDVVHLFLLLRACFRPSS